MNTVTTPLNDYGAIHAQNVGLRFYKVVHKIIALVLISWMNNGIFTYFAPYIPSVIRWSFFILWICIALLNKKFAKVFFVNCVPLFVFVGYLYILSLFVSQQDFYIKPIIYLIVIYSVFLYYFNDKYRKFQKMLSAFLIFDFVFIGINTYIKLQDNPLLARALSTGGNNAQKLTGESFFAGIGSYPFFYSLVAFILLLGYLFINSNKKYIKLLSIGAIFVFLNVLIKAAFTTSIIFAFGFLLIMLIIRYTNKYNLVFTSITLFIVFVFSQGLLVDIFTRLATINGLHSEISIRFIELANFFSGNNISGSDLADRQTRYSMSIKAFFQNFIGGTSLSPNYIHGVGGHSAWLDLLANFGIFSIPLIVFFIRAYRYCIKCIDLNHRTLINVCWLYFVLLGFINTLFFSSIFITWMMFVPFFVNSYLKGKSLQNSNGETT
jgi:hypothetical protein